jgi:hypothetical protein
VRTENIPKADIPLWTGALPFAPVNPVDVAKDSVMDKSLVRCAKPNPSNVSTALSRITLVVCLQPTQPVVLAPGQLVKLAADGKRNVTEAILVPFVLPTT